MHTTAAQIAAFFEQEHNFQGRKSQKMLYYAQALALTRRGVPLFADEFQAWIHGPVIKAVWDGERATPQLDHQDQQLLQETVAIYGHFTGEELSDLSHRDAPWQEARQNLPDEAKSDQVIPQKAIQDFYLGRTLGKNEDGQWVHLPPTDEVWCQARIQMLVAKQQYTPPMTPKQKADFMNRQVIATQRLEGIHVDPSQLVNG